MSVLMLTLLATLPTTHAHGFVVLVDRRTIANPVFLVCIASHKFFDEGNVEDISVSAFPK